MVSLAAVAKAYETRRGPRLAVDGVTFQVQPRQSVALVGPSGCGKSTILRIAAGLIEATSGTVEFRGRPVAGVPEDIAMLPQDYNQALLPWRSVLRNVTIAVEARRRRRARGSRREIDERARHYLEEVGLGEHVNSRPAELSGGMRQRVLLARALMTGASLLLMDEPFSALDAVTRLNGQDLVRKVVSAPDHPLSTLLVTHDVEEAIYMSDVVVVLGGRPSSVRREIPVELPPDRDQITTRATPEFLALRSEVLSMVTGRADEAVTA